MHAARKSMRLPCGARQLRASQERCTMAARSVCKDGRDRWRCQAERTGDGARCQTHSASPHSARAVANLHAGSLTATARENEGSADRDRLTGRNSIIHGKHPELPHSAPPTRDTACEAPFCFAHSAQHWQERGVERVIHSSFASPSFFGGLYTDRCPHIGRYADQRVMVMARLLLPGFAGCLTAGWLRNPINSIGRHIWSG